jgi:hypothetical protein
MNVVIETLEIGWARLQLHALPAAVDLTLRSAFAAHEFPAHDRGRIVTHVKVDALTKSGETLLRREI